MKLERTDKKVKFCFKERCLARKPQKGVANADETCSKRGCPLRKKTPAVVVGNDKFPFELFLDSDSNNKE